MCCCSAPVREVDDNVLTQVATQRGSRLALLSPFFLKEECDQLHPLLFLMEILVLILCAMATRKHFLFVLLQLECMVASSGTSDQFSGTENVTSSEKLKAGRFHFK